MSNLKKTVTPLEQEFLDMTHEIASQVGQDRLLTLIVSTLFLEPKEITMEDLAHKCGYSLASVSQKIKFLTPFNIVKKKTRPGSKKIYLYMKKNFLSTWLHQMINAQTTRVAIAKEKTPLILKKYKNRLKTSREKEIYKILQTYYKQIVIFDKILNSTIKLAKKYH